MKSEYGVEWFLKATAEELNNFFTSSSITDVIAVIEKIEDLKDMDFAFKERIAAIDSNMEEEKLRLDTCDRRIDFATKTNAPASEVEELWSRYEAIDKRLDKFNSEKEKIKQSFDDKKTSIINAARNAIKNAPSSLIEAHRLEVITYLQDEINSIEVGKGKKEITVDTLTTEPDGFTKEDIEARAIGMEIARLEDEVNSNKLALTDTLTAKIKAMRKKKEALEETTFTHICTQKLKGSLKGLSNDITELQLELYSILNLSTDEYRTRLVNRFNQDDMHFNICNAIKVYRDDVGEVANVPLNMKKRYRLICSSYNDVLNTLTTLKVDNMTLDDINSQISDLSKRQARLETYKKALIDNGKEEKYLYPSVREKGLFDLPFNEEKWHEYFGKLYEEISPSLVKLRDINTKYESLLNSYLVSSDIENRIKNYTNTLEDLLNNLYNQILSLYFKKNCLINVNIYDYRSREAYFKYVEYRKNSIDIEIDELKGKINSLNNKKSSLMSLLESNFNKIKEYKRELNAILNGEITIDKKEEEKENKDATLIPAPVEPLVNLDNLGKEETNVSYEEKEDTVHFEDSKPQDIINPNDIFGDTPEEKTNKFIIDNMDEKGINFDTPVVSFKPDNNIADFDSEISPIDKEAFKDLLEPKVQIPEPIVYKKPRGIKVIKMEDVKEENTSVSEEQEIVNRIKEGINSPKPLKNISSSDVLPEYNDMTAPINLSELKKETTTTDENIDLMSLLEQIQYNDDNNIRKTA